MLNSEFKAMIINRTKACWWIVLCAVTLTSCDTWIVMLYSVENTSEDEAKILVPYYRSRYSVDSLRVVDETIDSTLIIKPDETVLLSGVRLLYPSRRGYYRGQPGVRGVRRAYGDTLIEIKKKKKEWKFRKGGSVLILK